MKNYSYIKGIAELAQEFRKDNRIIPVVFDLGPIIKGGGGPCNYCGTLIRYKFVFCTPEEAIEVDRKAEICGKLGFEYYGIGRQCATKLTRYLGMPEDSVEKAITFFRKYIKLCELAKVEPKKAIELRKLDKEIERIREIRRKRAEALRREREKRFSEYEDKLEFIYARSLWLSEWEENFVYGCLMSKLLTKRGADIVERIYEKVKDISDEEVERQIEVELKARFIVHYGEYRIWNEAYRIIRDIYYRRPAKPLTEKQIKLIEKWHSILIRKENMARKWDWFKIEERSAVR